MNNAGRRPLTWTTLFLVGLATFLVPIPVVAGVRPAEQASAVIDELTTTTTQVFANPDGTRTAEIAAGPVRVPSETAPSGWDPIDTTLVASSAGFVPKAAVADIAFSDGAEGPAATLRDTGRVFGLKWPNPLPEPKVEGDTAAYPEVLPGVDLVLQATPTGFEQLFILRKRPAEALGIEVPMMLQGLTPSVDSRGLFALKGLDGSVFAQADSAIMWDATYDAHLDGPLHTSPVDIKIGQAETDPVLQIIPNAKFLASPDVTFPVVVDPTTDLSVAIDTYVESLYPTQSYGTDNELKVGAIDSGGQTQKARSFIRFGVTPISDTHVTSATLFLYENHSWSCTPKSVDVYRLTSSWSGPTWNTQPTYGSIYASKSFAHGYSSGCPNAWESISGGGGNGRTLTDLVQGWADGASRTTDLRYEPRRRT